LIGKKKSENQLEEIQQKIQYALNNHEQEKIRKKEFSAKIETLKTEIKVFLETSQSEMDPRSLMLMEQMQQMEFEKHKKNKKGKGV